MVETDREVNETLQEPALGLLRWRPDLFEHFVAVEKLAAIEEVNALLKQSLGVFCHVRLTFYLAPENGSSQCRRERQE
jgi:hypothetical protein